MKNKLFLLICLIVISISLKANDKTIIPITTDNISLIYKVGNNGRLYQSYVGQKLRFDSDIDQFAYAWRGLYHTWYGRLFRTGYPDIAQ